MTNILLINTKFKNKVFIYSNIYIKVIIYIYNRYNQLLGW